MARTKAPRKCLASKSTHHRKNAPTSGGIKPISDGSKNLLKTH